MAAKQTRKRNRPQETATTRLRRYVLVGAALGAYFGYFFRPVREEPSLTLVVVLSLISALAATLVKWWFTRQQAGWTPGYLLRYALRMWVTFAIFLAMLEGRHIAYDLGGRLAVIVFTTIAGAGLGLWYSNAARMEGR
jgi:hypothetical protein